MTKVVEGGLPLLMDKRVRDFWNERAKLKTNAGSNDFMLKELEIALLERTIGSGCRVLDIGCGDGATLMHLVGARGCSGVGVDAAENMIALATQQACDRRLDGHLQFLLGSLPDLEIAVGTFDYVLTERCLINLTSNEEQHAAFRTIMPLVNVGGCYLMLESSRQGLARVNALREQLALEPIEMPWHNNFVDEELVDRWQADGAMLEAIVPYSSTYYFLSRVVYACLAADSGEELRYDSAINKIGCQLPVIVDFGPARMWKWRRH